MSVNVIRKSWRVKYLRNTIIIVLFLLCGKGGSAEAPSAEQKQGNGSQQKASPSQSNAKETKSTVIKPPSEDGSQRNTYNIEKYNYNSDNEWNWSGTIQAIATLGLLAFAWWQMGSIKRTTKATEDAANAARDNAIAAKDAAEATKKNAEIAELALKVDRPYLLVEKVELIGFGKEGRPDHDPRAPRGLVAGMISFRNYGQGPARVKEITCAMRVVDNLLPARDYSECKEYSGFPDVIGQDKVYDVPVAVFGSVNEDSRKALWQGEKRLIAYGRLRYGDLAENRNYIGGFYLELNTFRKVLPDAEPMMSRGPKTHNYDEEEDTKPN